MKSITIVAHALLLAVVVMADDMQEMIQMLHNTCVEQSGVTEELIEKARKGDFTDDKTLKCYMKCIFTETSAMTEDGVLDAEAVIAMIPDQHRDEGARVIHICKKATGADACEIAFNMHKCSYKENPQLYFLV